MSKLNEFSLDLGATAIMPTDGSTPDQSVVIGTPNPAPTPDSEARYISVFANSITPNTYSPKDDVVTFDVVFSVGIDTGNQTETYQVVKRIGVSRAKIAEEAKQHAPVSVVEAKKTAAKSVVTESFDLERIRLIAGVKK